MFKELYFYRTLASPVVWEFIVIPTEHAPFWNFVEAERAEVVEHYDYLSMWDDYQYELDMQYELSEEINYRTDQEIAEDLDAQYYTETHFDAAGNRIGYKPYR